MTPPDGFTLVTVFAFAVVLLASAVRFTVLKPSAFSASSASDTDIPTRLVGIVAFFGPTLTSMVTVEPTGTRTPGSGFWLITRLTVASSPPSIGLTTTSSCASCSCCSARSRLRSVTLGTATCGVRASGLKYRYVP